MKFSTYEISSAYNSNAIRKHKLGKIKSSTLLVVVQNTKLKGEQPSGNEYQTLLLYLKSQTGFNVCFDHTEAANAIVASKVLFTNSDKEK
ncbi:uncharacterized protein LOC115992021 isoform X2 [Quercus lobata]|uniref:uncharacterized protein LOC115992021 isoform X2 n=1 Tax=Quercus lobata TaxID=97700 RepID=UPI001246F587|nr:uncharacterized protein LOC115992021 isoform X2 [Quercus lobata]